MFRAIPLNLHTIYISLCNISSHGQEKWESDKMIGLYIVPTSHFSFLEFLQMLLLNALSRLHSPGVSRLFQQVLVCPLG